MSLLDRIKRLILADRIAKWPTDDRTALIRLLYSALVADEAFTADERAWLQATMHDIGLTWAQVHEVELPEALRRLHGEPAKEEQLYPLLAEALFADGDFDNREKGFVGRLCDQGLSRARLDAEIQRVRGRVLDGALTEWNREIESGDPKP